MAAPFGSRLLPVRPRPEPHELLSSWLFRLAQANSQKLHTLSVLLFSQRNIWNRDIDRLAGLEVLAALEGATGVPASTLRLHTLVGYEGRVYRRHNAHGVTAWVLPLGIYHRTRTRHGLQYCPGCLRDRPAFLTVWRLSLSVACPVHGCLLLAACFTCGAPVIPHRNDVAQHLSKSLPTRSPHTRCFQCGAALDRAPLVPAPPEVVAWQATLHQAVQGDGVMTVPGVGQVPVLEYLTVARLWLTLLTFGRKAERLRALVAFPVTLPTGIRGRSFEHLAGDLRVQAITLLIQLFEGWPERPVQWARAARLRRGILLQEMLEPPAWYLEMLRPLENVNPRRPLCGPLSLEEVQAQAASGSFEHQVLSAYSEGQSLREVARQFGIKPDRVRWLVRRFNKGQGCVHKEESSQS